MCLRVHRHMRAHTNVDTTLHTNMHTQAFACVRVNSCVNVRLHDSSIAFTNAYVHVHSHEKQVLERVRTQTQASTHELTRAKSHTHTHTHTHISLARCVWQSCLQRSCDSRIPTGWVATRAFQRVGWKHILRGQRRSPYRCRRGRLDPRSWGHVCSNE